MTKTLDVKYLEPERVTVCKDGSNNVSVEVDGEGKWSKVVARLAFPYSDPERYVILRGEEEEIGIVRDPAELDDGSRELLQQMLAKRYHIPTIHRILAVDDAHNATRWTVETDRGVREFLVRDRHNFRRIRGGDRIIVDVDGNRFRVPRHARFDKRSQKLFDLHG